MPSYTKSQLESLLPVCTSYTDILRNFGLCLTGGNNAILKKWLKIWQLDISHFETPQQRGKRLSQIKTHKTFEEKFCVGSTTNRNTLKAILYRMGLKTRTCEECGQGETWRGKKMSLILDHVNGIRNDNRLENLRILCPCCNATLETHCGRKNKKKNDGKKNKLAGLKRRKVTRPISDVLLNQISSLGYCATGRLYGVSDNAIRKWELSCL